MFVTEDVPLELQLEPLDRLAAAVRDVRIDKQARTADPHLPVQARHQSDNLDAIVAAPSYVFVHGSKRAWEGRQGLLGCSIA